MYWLLPLFTKKTFKNVARAHTLYKPAVKMRVVTVITASVSVKRPGSNLDPALSGPLLRLLCHHAHMLANLSVSREYRELPQIIIKQLDGRH